MTTTEDYNASLDWRGARGESWCVHVDGLEALLASINAPLVEALRLDAPHAVADIGCGGGGASRAVIAAARPGSTVHGFDVSEALVAAARQRVPSVEFFVRDVATSDAPVLYDRLVSRFGVMFFADAPQAFSNLTRWLRPGGRLAFAVWGPIADNRWAGVVRDVVAERVELPAPLPDAPGPFRYADVSALTALLDGAGFESVHAEAWRGRLPLGATPATAAEFALGAFSSFAVLLNAAGEAVVAGARRALTEAFAQHVHDGGVALEARVHIVTAERPAG
ncbi:MAG: methyltransferase domain-containing protein [Deltaproteobacteria bacterium]